jgi:hypothetical protein
MDGVALVLLAQQRQHAHLVVDPVYGPQAALIVRDDAQGPGGGVQMFLEKIYGEHDGSGSRVNGITVIASLPVR